VSAVDTDMDAHTVTVEFDDEELAVDEIIQTLGKAGYTVPEHTKVH
jgi:copper chaperone CopZ